MKPYAYLRTLPNETQVDWSRVCRECWQFPNRCDHVPLPRIFLQLYDSSEIHITAERTDR